MLKSLESIKRNSLVAKVQYTFFYFQDQIIYIQNIMCNKKCYVIHATDIDNKICKLTLLGISFLKEGESCP